MADAPNGVVKKKKSKLEKIAELESSLKLSKEENRRLKKEVHLLKNVGPGGAPASPRKSSASADFFAAAAGNQEELDKMKDALKALKRVTINQEMSLQSLRAKASQRRQELEARDQTIGKMKRHIAHLKKQLNATQGGGGSLQDQCQQLQEQVLEKDSQVHDLQERLSQANANVRTLERRLDESNNNSDKHSNKIRRGPWERSNSNNSMKSMESSADMSISTAQEFDLSKLKKEIAKKSSKIVDLEYQLELVKDQLHEVKISSSNNNNNNNHDTSSRHQEDGDFVDFGAEGGGNFFSGQPGGQDDFYDSDHGGEEDDDW
eukprot:CAMPEP_0168742282 /NCGR_PEP_ID=MMETSP0724-20121128/12955_1 /TAXON_ID=265536 /ORGANISM="Amphiprora sp., Strain CCMP467" /LENGTH=318 /DNA_ID=CAMNT_0008789825 /DNA_START=114 /DNA_END=1067 /DNA_ORIENTATION=+